MNNTVIVLIRRFVKASEQQILNREFHSVLYVKGAHWEQTQLCLNRTREIQEYVVLHFVCAVCCCTSRPGYRPTS